jgi:hypothetical protein
MRAGVKTLGRLTNSEITCVHLFVNKLRKKLFARSRSFDGLD